MPIDDLLPALWADCHPRKDLLAHAQAQRSLSHCSWASGRRVKNRGLDLTQRKNRRSHGPGIFSGTRLARGQFLRGSDAPAVLARHATILVFHQCSVSRIRRGGGTAHCYGKSRVRICSASWCQRHTTLCCHSCGIMCHNVSAHCVASHACMFEYMFVSMSQRTGVLRRRLATKTCGEELQGGIAAKTCGEDMRRGDSAKICGEYIRRRILRQSRRRFLAKSCAKTDLRRFRRRSGEEWAKKHLGRKTPKQKLLTQNSRFPQTDRFAWLNPPKKTLTLWLRLDSLIRILHPTASPFVSLITEHKSFFSSLQRKIEIEEPSGQKSGQGNQAKAAHSLLIIVLGSQWLSLSLSLHDSKNESLTIANRNLSHG